MSGEQLKRLAIGLGVLLALWLGLTMVRGSGSDTGSAFRLTRVDPTKITSVTVAGPVDTVRLLKAVNGWTVNGEPASQALVLDLLAGLADSSVTGDVISESKASLTRYGLDSAHANRLTVRAGDKELVRYLLGTQNPVADHVFVRMENADRVYQVSGRLAEVNLRKPNEWRDKTILSLQADSIAGVDVRVGKTSYSVERAGAGWTIDKAPTDTTAVMRWLAQLAGLEAIGFATQGQMDSADWSKASRSLRVRGKAGQQLAALVFDSTSEGFLVRREGQGAIYRLLNATTDDLTPAPKALQVKPK